MPGTFLNYPFDDEIFIHSWKEQPDLVKNALLQSGVMVESPEITAALTGYGNFFTVPFYKPLSGEPANYDGQTDIPVGETEGGSMSGVAYGRTRGFKERDFVRELTGADPMGHIVRTVHKYWQDQRQKKLVDVLDASLGVTGFNTHTATVQRPNKSEELPGLLNLKFTEIMGEQKRDLRMLVMDSMVAAELENLALLKFRMGVDAYGVERSTQIADFLGYTVIVDDAAMAGKTNTVFALGLGALLTGAPRLDKPAELGRDPKSNGGETVLYTRIRDVIHPNGFDFVKPKTGWKESPTDDQLKASANYKLVYEPKAVPILKINLTPAAIGP